MRYESATFALPPSNANSPALDLRDIEQASVQLNASNATLQLQASIDGVSFTAVGSAVLTGASAIVGVPDGMRYVRVVVSAFSAIGSSALLGGRGSRTV